MSGSVLRILYGPPGTGKTFRAAREAVRLIDGAVDEVTVAVRHEQLVHAGRVQWVTFHPSYTYEDFVEGFRPVLREGSVAYVVRDGPFRLACRAAAGDDALVDLSKFFRPGQLLTDQADRESYEVIGVDAGGVIVKGKAKRKQSGGEGATLHLYADFYSIRLAIRAGLKPLAFCLQSNATYGPTDIGLSLVADARISGTDARQLVADQLRQSTTNLNSANYKGAVMEALGEEVWAQVRHEGSRQPQSVVLVIDEINRADLSRVFGELMTLLEHDKRAGQPEERRVLLPYSRELYSVPPTLSIIGTMNTADRSLAVIDLALRRRFEFEEVAPDPDRCPTSYGGVNIANLLRHWNAAIAALRSREHRIGHSELMHVALERAREQWSELPRDDGEPRSLASVLRHKILPLLLEYFRDDWRKAAAVIGPSLLTTAPMPSGLEDFGLDESLLSFDAAQWWDPFGQEWDAGRFLGALSKPSGT